MQQQGGLVGRDHVTTAAEVPVYDPSTGEVFAVTADFGPAEMEAAVSSARAATAGWARTAPADRGAVLRRLSGLILRDLDRLALIEARQTGKPMKQARRDTEITARYFDFYASAIETFYGTSIPLNDDTVVTTTWHPHGVTGHIIPWNYPLQIMGRSVAASLAMGNCCVVKPAEEAPLSILAVAELALEAGAPVGAFNVATGYGETAGAALTSHPGIDHISFTGSVAVGKLVGHAAAERVIPATLELGGKSPNIVFADADLDRAIPVVANAILQNAGQTCSAGSRLIVERSIHDEVVRRLAAHFAAVRVGTALSDPDLGPVINPEARDRIVDFADLGRRDAHVAFGGNALSGGDFGKGYFVEPTLIDNVDPASRLAQEEIFGPVLAVMPFDGLDDAVRIANSTDYGLVAGVWTRNVSTAHRMIKEIVSGQVFVNTYGASGGVELPFGGFKRSGYGREKGAEGLRGFGAIKTSVIAI